MFRIFFFTLLFSVISSCVSANDSQSAAVDFNGKWQNTLGSELHFIVSDGVVRGSYNTNVGQPDKSKSFPLVGQSEGDQITFTVNFKGFDSMTAWVGQVTIGANNKPYLRTLWHNTKDIDDDKEAKDIWGSIRTGASEFTRIEER